MNPLTDQLELETLIGRNPDQPAPRGITVIYFTAKWCGACRHIQKELLMTAIPEAKWRICDVDENIYTPGYCGVRAIPAFLLIRDGRILGSFQSNQHAAIIAWLNGLLT
jgi:thioredoxin-like negative regulator of GroEL